MEAITRQEQDALKLVVYFIVAMVGDLLLLLACGFTAVAGPASHMMIDGCPPGDDSGFCSNWGLILAVLALPPWAILPAAVVLTWRKPKKPDADLLPNLWAPSAGFLALGLVWFVANLLADGALF